MMAHSNPNKKRGKQRIFAALMVLTLAAPALAGWDEGMAAYNRGDYEAALREFRPLADQGKADAQVKLGFMYKNGLGVPRDYTEAMKWCRLAAEQGNSAAQYYLGVMYGDGQGAPQDYAEAMKWYRLAAEQGVAEAQFNVGLLYADGFGVPQDYMQAHMWLNLAAAQYPPSKTYEHEGMVEIRDKVAAKMTPTQIAEAQKLAREWQAAFEKKNSGN